MNETIAGRITLLVDLFKTHSETANELTTKANAEQELANKIVREDLPELLREAELQELQLADGTKIKLLEKVHASITEAKKVAAHAWLIENGFGGIIKTRVIVAFPASEQPRAAALESQLSEEYGDGVQVENAVHAATLKAFVAEQLEAGKALPTDLFGIFTFSEVKVTAPKLR